MVVTEPEKQPHGLTQVDGDCFQALRPHGCHDARQLTAAATRG